MLFATNISSNKQQWMSPVRPYLSTLAFLAEIVVDTMQIKKKHWELKSDIQYIVSDVVVINTCQFI